MEENIFDAFKNINSNNSLNMMLRLYVSDKNNKTYKICLENEVNESIKVLTKSLKDNELMFFYTMINILPIDQILKEYPMDEETRLRIEYTRKIINAVYKNRYEK